MLTCVGMNGFGRVGRQSLKAILESRGLHRGKRFLREEKNVLMNKIVILYGSSEGQTAKIAHSIAEVINKMGYTAEVIDGRNLPAHFSLEPYSAAIIGTSLHVGGYQASIRRFVQQHQQALALLPTAFFSVSLTEAYPQPEEKVHLTQLMTTFLRETGWHPQKIASFAGALAYSKYGFLKGFVMRRIAHKVGAPTDSSHDY